MASAPKMRKVEANGKQDEEEYVKQIDTIQNELDKLNELASEEILAVEKKYNLKRQPFYQQRADLIKTIPNFWLTAIKNHPALYPLITDNDYEVLTHMKNVEVEEFEDIKSGFKITLTFSENNFFKNVKISKSIHVGENELKTKCDPIEWYPNQDFVSTMAQNDEKLNESNMSLPKSFMYWFSNSKSESMVELGEVIKDDLWPNPLQYFFANEAFDDEEDGEDDEDGDEDDDLDEEEEDYKGEDDGEGEEDLAEDEEDDAE